MLKILGLILAILVVAVAAVLAYASTKPSTFKVTRTAVIDAPPEAIYPLINNLAAWRDWSAYELKDPAMQRTYSGPASGVGASYAWSGDPKKIGSGRMEITRSVPSSLVGLDLTFITPFKANNSGTFTLTPQGASTKVTWTMDGPSPLISKVMGLFMDMDAMIGGDFEAGLARLKAQAEA